MEESRGRREAEREGGRGGEGERGRAERGRGCYCTKEERLLLVCIEWDADTVSEVRFSLPDNLCSLDLFSVDETGLVTFLDSGCK